MRSTDVPGDGLPATAAFGKGERICAAERRTAGIGQDANVDGGARASRDTIAWYSQSSRKFVFAEAHVQRKRCAYATWVSV